MKNKSIIYLFFLIASGKDITFKCRYSSTSVKHNKQCSLTIQLDNFNYKFSLHCINLQHSVLITQKYGIAHHREDKDANFAGLSKTRLWFFGLL